MPGTSNPFSTCFVRPGALPFRFPAGATASHLVRQLHASGWRGQIVGPHGAGKTTLLHALAPELRRAGRQLAWTTLQAGQRSLPAAFVTALRSADESTLVVVDGFEQLGLPARWRLRRACPPAGLLVTSHRPVPRLPVLMRVDCSLEVVQQLVDQLLSAAAADCIRPTDVAQCYRRCRQNVRDTFFTLYDLYEQRRWRK